MTHAMRALFTKLSNPAVIAGLLAHDPNSVDRPQTVSTRLVQPNIDLLRTDPQNPLRWSSSVAHVNTTDFIADSRIPISADSDARAASSAIPMVADVSDF